MSIRPLSNIDIQKKLSAKGLDIQFIPYHILKHYEDINDILPCILLYELHYPIGHWVALFRNGEGINYFDSTGEVPDALLETNFAHPSGRVKMGADYTYLNRLLLNSGENIIYNDKPLQTKNTNTCGYWCAVRLLCWGIPQDKFVNEFMHKNGAQRQKIIVQLYNKL